MFKVAVNHWSIAPSEFWQMTVDEWWWLYDAKHGEQRKQDRDTMNELHRLLKASKQQ